MWIVVHSTRGGQENLHLEYQATLNWFKNTASQVSSHTVIGTFEGQHARVVPDQFSAWHAGEHNPYSLGVELVQPTKDHPYSDWQYAELARLIAYWKGLYPIEQVLGHDQTPQGIRVGKSDPGSQFDWERI